MGLVLQTGDLVFVDTAPFVYFFEQHATFFPYVEKLFDQVFNQNAQVITSIVTFIEIAILPARMGNQALVDQYRAYFTNSSRVSLAPVTLEVANHAIALRAQYSLKTPDAIQLGTAIAHSATHVVTNDQQWKQVASQNVVLVNEI